MIHDLRDMLTVRLDRRHAEIAASVIDGGATDYADYRERVGRARGLLDAHELIDHAIKELTDDDDD